MDLIVNLGVGKHDDCSSEQGQNGSRQNLPESVQSDLCWAMMLKPYTIMIKLLEQQARTVFIASDV